MKINRIFIYILILSYKFLLDYGYVLYVNPLFSYNGFFLDLNLKKYIFSIFFIMLLTFLFIKESGRFSLSILNMLFLIMLIPFLSLYALENQPTVHFLFVMFGFSITLVICRTKPIRGISFEASPKLFWLLIAILSSTTFVGLFFFNGLPSLTAINLLDVYEVRSSVNYGPLIFSYLIPWQAKVINPVLLGIGILNKKRNIFFVGLTLQMTLFLYTGHKAYLFIPLVVIGVGYAIKKKRLLITALLGLNVTIVTCLVMYKYFNEGLLASLFLRRTMFVPMKNYYYYLDFFSENEKTHLAHSIFGSFLIPNYDMPTPNLIGAIYYNNPDTWVNAGYLADAYANFGVMGILIFAIVLGLLLKVFDYLALNIGIEMVTVASFMAFFSLLSGALLTTMLTGGILISLLLLLLYNPSASQRSIERKFNL